MNTKFYGKISFDGPKYINHIGFNRIFTHSKHMTEMKESSDELFFSIVVIVVVVVFFVEIIQHWKLCSMDARINVRIAQQKKRKWNMFDGRETKINSWYFVSCSMKYVCINDNDSLARLFVVERWKLLMLDSVNEKKK